MPSSHKHVCEGVQVPCQTTRPAQGLSKGPQHRQDSHRSARDTHIRHQLTSAEAGFTVITAATAAALVICSSAFCAGRISRGTAVGQQEKEAERTGRSSARGQSAGRRRGGPPPQEAQVDLPWTSDGGHSRHHTQHEQDVFSASHEVPLYEHAQHMQQAGAAQPATQTVVLKQGQLLQPPQQAEHSPHFPGASFSTQAPAAENPFTGTVVQDSPLAAVRSAPFQKILQLCSAHCVHETLLSLICDLYSMPDDSFALQMQAGRDHRHRG